jgi:hypothetical protein
MKLHGEEHAHTILTANNYATILVELRRFEEANSLLCKMIPVARRLLGESNDITLRMRGVYAFALSKNCVTLDDLHEAVSTLEDVERIARRVLGSAHPLTKRIVCTLRNARDTLRARETPPGS